jgi:hypothetical protein
MERHGVMILTKENQRNRIETCPSATTNPMWTDLGTNPGLCGERLLTNFLSKAEYLLYMKFKRTVQ